ALSSLSPPFSSSSLSLIGQLSARPPNQRMRLHTLLYTLCLLHATADADTAPCDKTLILGFDQDALSRSTTPCCFQKMTYTENKLKCNKEYQVLGYTDGAAGAKQAHFLTCDPAAAAPMWKDEAGVDTTLPATSQITVTACADNPCDEKMVKPEDGAVFAALTTPPHLASLNIEGNPYSDLQCEKGAKGWTDTSGATKFADTATFTAKCGDPAVPPPTPTCARILLEVEATFELGVLRCVAPGKALKLNSKFYPTLTCTGGKWKDDTGTEHGEDTVPLTATCEDVPCSKVGNTPLCLAFDAIKPKPEGYECLEDEPSPFDKTDNAYQANCNGAAQKSQIYGLTTKTFYNYAPLCHKDAIWHDKDQQTIPDEPNQLICVHKRCNSCTKLEEATGSATASNYTEGTASECAQATCHNNLWMIQKEGATSEVEYAGEVTCSTETNNTWLIDGKDAIGKGSCVTSVKCKEAVRLITTCEAAWTTGCAEPILSDDAAAPCKGNKMMFYKKPEDTYFEGNVTSIECNKDKGHWKVKTNGRAEEDTLKRGGSLVCADENPSPKPPPPACWKFVSQRNRIQFDTEKAGIVEGKLNCTGDGKWRSADGKEVGLFAAYIPDSSDEQDQQKQQGAKAVIIGCSIGGAVIFLVILVVVFKVVMGSRKRKTEEEKEKEEKRKRMAEEGKKRQKSRGNNDEILDEVSSQAPSEIKL
ncbi:hypothetical protein PRIPAC_88558, partial [Pristionchus pacificus]|uniref:Uncharacterized protein n=1 Tax=Pristionchus pacificus TaxID=54126 RepID=A0A2A6B9M2_PRIPA